MMFKRHGFFGSGSSDVWWSLRSSRLTGVDPTVVTKDESWQFYGMNRLRTNWRNGHNKWEFYGILHERNGHWLEILHIWPEMGIEIWKWEENWDLHRFSRLNLWSSMWIWIQQTPGATANWNHWGLEGERNPVMCVVTWGIPSHRWQWDFQKLQLIWGATLGADELVNPYRLLDTST